MFAITVPSSVAGTTYTVRKVAEADVWTCTCPDSINRSNGSEYSCKHVAAITSSLNSFATKAKHSKKSAEILGL